MASDQQFLEPERDPRQPALVGQRIGYARVSTPGQNLDRQRHALTAAGATRIFEDVADRATETRTRPGMAALLDYAREGDHVVIAAVDRLGRTATEARDMMTALADRGITLEVLSLNVTVHPDGTDLATRLVLGIMIELAQGEAEWIAARQAEGIARARARGVYTGRAPALTADQLEQLRERAHAGVPIARLARDLSISRSTVYAALRDDYKPRGGARTGS